MTEYIVGLRLGKRSEVLTIEAEDALIAALKANSTIRSAIHEAFQQGLITGEDPASCTAGWRSSGAARGPRADHRPGQAAAGQR